MKKLFFVITLGVIVTTSCSNNSEKNATNSPVKISTQKIIKKDVSAEEFAILITKEKGQILDVRTPEEWETGVIKGAIKMNFYDNNFAKQLEKLDKTKPVFVYCKAGSRGGKAADQMEKMGFTTIYNLSGGITAWNKAGKALVK